MAEKIKKVTSGSTPEIADIVDSIYNAVLVNGTHKAPSIKVAEASKIIENSKLFWFSFVILLQQIILQNAPTFHP